MSFPMANQEMDEAMQLAETCDKFFWAFPVSPSAIVNALHWLSLLAGRKWIFIRQAPAVCCSIFCTGLASAQQQLMQEARGGHQV